MQELGEVGGIETCQELVIAEWVHGSLIQHCPCGVYFKSFYNTKLRTMYIYYFDPAIPLLGGIHPMKTTENVCKYLATKTFTITLFLKVDNEQ